MEISPVFKPAMKARAEKFVSEMDFDDVADTSVLALADKVWASFGFDKESRPDWLLTIVDKALQAELKP